MSNFAKAEETFLVMLKKNPDLRKGWLDLLEHEILTCRNITELRDKWDRIMKVVHDDLYKSEVVEPRMVYKSGQSNDYNPSIPA